jgi:hypothetical protein
MLESISPLLEADFSNSPGTLDFLKALERQCSRLIAHHETLIFTLQGRLDSMKLAGHPATTVKLEAYGALPQLGAFFAAHRKLIHRCCSLVKDAPRPLNLLQNSKSINTFSSGKTL